LAIDKALVNLYTCCKCNYKWTNWNSKEGRDGPIPVYCPHCKNVRWNKEYTKEEDFLFDKVQEQHTLDRVKKKVKALRHS
jgi:hypothetical protein